MRFLSPFSTSICLLLTLCHVVVGVNLFQNGLTGVQLGSFFGTVPMTNASPSFDYVVRRRRDGWPDR